MPSQFHARTSPPAAKVDCRDISSCLRAWTTSSLIRINFNQSTSSLLKISPHTVDVGSNKSDRSLKSAVMTDNTIDEIFHSLAIIWDTDCDVGSTITEIFHRLAMVGDMLL